MSAASPYIPQFPLLERGRARRYGVALTMAVALILAGIALVDFAVDPFQQYRRPTWYEPHYYRTLQRFEGRSHFARALIALTRLLRQTSGDHAAQA